MGAEPPSPPSCKNVSPPPWINAWVHPCHERTIISYMSWGRFEQNKSARFKLVSNSFISLRESCVYSINYKSRRFLTSFPYFPSNATPTIPRENPRGRENSRPVLSSGYHGRVFPSAQDWGCQIWCLEAGSRF